MSQRSLILILFAFLLIFVGGLWTEVSTADRKATTLPARASIAQSFGKVPLSFEANQGQTDPKVKFLSRGSGYELFLTPDEAVLLLHKAQSAAGSKTNPVVTAAAKVVKKSIPSSSADVLSIRLIGSSNNAPVEGVEQMSGRSNYLIGKDAKKWLTNIPNFAKVKYRNVYPGIDLVYRGSNQRQLEYDFLLAAGADPKVIEFQIKGAKKMVVGPRGDLVLHTGGGDIIERAPVIYQEIGGKRREVAGKYVVTGVDRAAFRLASYDKSQPLVIDPVLVYSTYLGGSAEDSGVGIAVDSSGNAYVTGQTESTDFPTKAGSYQTSLAGIGTLGGGSDGDAFVTKLNPAGSSLVYSTYIGGNSADIAEGIAVDASGNAYITGLTDSTNFPTTSGAFQTTYPGAPSWDAFITKLNPSGSALVYSTYLGGSGGSEPYGDSTDAIAIDSVGNAYVTGSAGSFNFPTTAGAYQTGGPGNSLFVFVTKLNASGSALVYSTWIGGGSNSSGAGIAVDSLGDAYIAQHIQGNTLPTTLGAYQTSTRGLVNAGVTKLDPTGSFLIYSTYVGGSNEDGCRGMALDGAGNAYITGLTNSSDFPTTPGAFQTTFGTGTEDAFVTELNSTGSQLLYSTYLGGSGDNEADAMTIDGSGDAYIAGYTNATNFPVTANAIQPASGGGYDNFVTVLNPNGSGLLFSSYLGGSGDEFPDGITLDSLGQIYLVGATSSTNFPTTPGAFHTTYGGGSFDAFVTKIGAVVPTPTPSPTATATPTATPTPVCTQPKTKDDCKDGGWQNFCNPSFPNQGQCVSWVNHNT